MRLHALTHIILPPLVEWGMIAIAVGVLSVFAAAIGLLLGVMLSSMSVRGHELHAQLALEPGETIEDRAARSAWYARQKMPDSPGMSCCGEADAYYADSVWVDDKNNVYAVITDTRPDAPLRRPHIPIGTKILIPPTKNKDTRGDPNPTGHTVIFTKYYDNDDGGSYGTLCYLPNGGI